MATRTWSGAAGDGNFNTVTNWTASTLPVTGDSVIVSANATSGMSSNLDRSADGAGAGLNIVTWTIQKGFRYNIGSSSVPLKLSADKFVDNGNGALYFTSDTGTDALNTDRLIIDKDATNMPVAIYGSGDSNITLIEITRAGQVTIGDGAASLTITNLWIAPRTGGDSISVFGNASTTVSGSVFIGGGMLTIDGMETTLVTLGDGVLDFRSSAIAALTQTGGVVLHNGEASNYAITLYNALGGYLESTETGGGKLISTLNRTPRWESTYNPELTVSTTNYIGG